MSRGASGTSFRGTIAFTLAVGSLAVCAGAQTASVTRTGSATTTTTTALETVRPGNISGGSACAADEECEDFNACTTDACTLNVCINSPLPDCIPCAPGYECPTLEVVFVVDTSGSMRDEGGALCNLIDDLVDSINALGGDIRPAMLGITETPSTSFPCLTGNVASLLGTDVPGDAATCPLAGNPSAFESWGPGTAIAAERYPWLTGAFRMVVPVSDEGPCGGDFPDGCNDPGDDRDSIQNAIDVALRNRVIVSPIMGSGSGACAIALGMDAASTTGGTVVLTKASKGSLREAVRALLVDVCRIDDACDDGDSCTCDDTCVAGRCDGQPVPDCKPCNATGVCSDGNACTNDVCLDFDCVSTPNYDVERFYCDPVTGALTPLEELDDGNPCTELTLDPCTGLAVHFPVLDRTPCEDGLFCTEGDVCVSGVCTGQIEVDCSLLDGPCALGVCDDDQNACVASAAHENGPCDDGNACQVGEVCTAGLCTGGGPPSCPATGNVCTARACDPAGAEGNCDDIINVNENGPCSDNNACTTGDVCVSGICTGGPPPICEDGNPCTNNTCNPLTGCVSTPRTGACEDGDFCTTGDTCQGGVCVGGPPPQCVDNNVCTTDLCDSESGCVFMPNNITCNDGNLCTLMDRCQDGACVGRDTLDCDDDNPCTDDSCEPASGCVNTGNDDPCDDAQFCTINDTCTPQGDCAGTEINTIPCANDAACFGAACDNGTGFCVCSERPSLCLEAKPGGLGIDGCYQVNDQILVHVRLGMGASAVAGGQFFIPYDPAVLDFMDIRPGSQVDPTSPFSVEVTREVDEIAGKIYYAVGVPVGASGTHGPAVMATIRFRALSACSSTDLCFAGENLRNTMLRDDQGQPVLFVPCCAEINIQSQPVVLTCPDDVAVNADAGFATAEVHWNPVSVSGGCSGLRTLQCTATHTDGVNIDNLIATGGRLPKGLSRFACVVTDVCGEVASCDWSAYVSPANLVEVSVQLSPVMTDRSLFRCITFEFYASCPDPVVIEETIEFGGPFNLAGHADVATFKIPAGRYECVAARDPMHTLRAVADIYVVGTRFQATFKGDPFFGGNWLRNGNLNDDRVINVVDFGMFINEYLKVVSPHTPCGSTGINADFNGDGLVDSLDHAMQDIHFLESDKASCCDGFIAGMDMLPITEISVAELERIGLGELRVADLNGDGWVNETDRRAFAAGVRPTFAKPAREAIRRDR